MPRTAGLSIVAGILSWIALFWPTPQAFASSAILGAFAIWLACEAGLLRGAANFGALVRSAIGGASGLTATLLAILLWVAVWPEASARHSRETQAQALLAKIAAQTNGTLPARLPEFSKPGGLYGESVAITLAPESSDSLICYTLDGSEPTTASRIYTEPIMIAQTATLKAKAFRPGFKPSDVAADTYLIAERELTNFTSNLPLVVINTHGRPILREPHTKVFARFISPSDGRTHLTGAADYSGPAEMHLRGSSTLKFPKHSYSFTAVNEKSEHQKVSIFGMPKDSDWVLYAPYQDKTLMRDVLAYELSAKMGHYSVRTKFVEVFINSSGGKITRGDYAGVYVFEEKIKRGKERVNIEQLTAKDNTEPKISGGYIFKRDHNDRNESGFYTRYGGPYYYVYPKEKEITPAQKRWLRGYMDRFENALYGSDFADPEKGYRAFLDVDSFIDQHWLIEMSKNVDGFRYSVYLHKDRDGKLKLEPVWDWNLSFGNADFYQGWSTYQWYNLHLRPSEISWYRRLRQDPEFMQRCVDRWAQLRTNLFNPDRISKRIDEMASELQESQARNFNRWGIMGSRVHANWYVGRNYRDEVNWMKRWIRDRIAWIDGQLMSAPKVKVQEAAVGERALQIESSGGMAYYTLDGSDPREPGGAISAKAVAYTGLIPVANGASIFVRTLNGTNWSPPTAIQSDAPVQAASLR